jgi:4-hydroxy-4-methyl-2-oxoglutarate aldolase
MRKPSPNKPKARASGDVMSRIRKELFVALLSDSLDAAGYQNQAFPPRIRCLDDELFMVGRARTALYRDVYHIEPGTNPYELEIKLVDDLKAGEIAILSCGASGRIAPWGSLLTIAARARGAVGCVTDGCVRDIKAIRKAQFPVFHGGIAPLDSKGRGVVTAIDVPIECAEVRVESGDLVAGDADGIIVIPRKIEKKVLSIAFDRVKKESETEQALLRGEKLADVFRRVGVL